MASGGEPRIHRRHSADAPISRVGRGRARLTRENQAHRRGDASPCEGKMVLVVAHRLDVVLAATASP